MPGGSWICPLDSNQKKLIVTAKRRLARVTGVYATAAAIPNITMKGSGKKLWRHFRSDGNAVVVEAAPSVTRKQKGGRWRRLRRRLL